MTDDHRRWARDNIRTPYLPHKVLREDRADGTIRLRSGYDLPDTAPNTGAWLHRWAKDTPDAVAVAERDGEGWREVTYAALLAEVRALAAGLLARGYGPEDRIAILSGNGVDHLILTLAAQYIGVPTSPLAEQYSLIHEAHPRLAYVLGKLRPRMAFVDDAARFADALALPEMAGIEVVAARNHDTLLADLKTTPGPTLDAAHAQVGPDTLAKVLFTSGSSSDPKGVQTTHRMMCVNQAQIAAVLPFLADHPPQITDWLPWNHVFGGSHNVNMMLANGGTIRIDGGKPAAALFDTSRRNLAEHPPSLLFNVPVGFALLCDAVDADDTARRAIFSALDLIFYAGASLPQPVWDRLEKLCMDEMGGLPLMVSSWGLTETAPAVLLVHEPIGRSGVIGVPLPGVEIKLIPDEEMRCEIRVKGPNVTPGYFDDPDKTRTAFDDEGFFITGDAVKFVDPGDANRGLVFDGRVSEDFKLNTGSWVQAGMLRMSVLKELSGLVQDVVICGHDRGEIGLFIFPAPGLAEAGQVTRGAVTDAHLMARVEEALRAMNAHVTGSAKRITRAIILAEPPSVAGQEITDKGSLNINKILTRRAELLERLYDNEDPALIRV